MNSIKTKSFEIAANIKGDENSSRVAILMPGRLDTKDYANFVSHLDHLSKRGFLAVAIDPPGTWDSKGDLKNYSTTTYLKAVNELIEHFGNKPTLLLGHSRGGATAMLASANPAIDRLILVNASYGKPTPPKPEEIKDDVLVELRDLPPGNMRTKDKVVFNLPMSYFDDATQHDPLNALMNFKGPKLLIHADEDEFTTLSKVQKIYDTLPEPKMFLRITGTHDYRLFPEVIKSVEDTIGQFLSK